MLKCQEINLSDIRVAENLDKHPYQNHVKIRNPKFEHYRKKNCQEGASHAKWQTGCLQSITTDHLASPRLKTGDSTVDGKAFFT